MWKSSVSSFLHQNSNELDDNDIMEMMKQNSKSKEKINHAAQSKLRADAPRFQCNALNRPINHVASLEIGLESEKFSNIFQNIQDEGNAYYSLHQPSWKSATSSSNQIAGEYQTEYNDFMDNFSVENNQLNFRTSSMIEMKNDDLANHPYQSYGDSEHMEYLYSSANGANQQRNRSLSDTTHYRSNVYQNQLNNSTRHNSFHTIDYTCGKIDSSFIKGIDTPYLVENEMSGARNEAIRFPTLPNSFGSTSNVPRSPPKINRVSMEPVDGYIYQVQFKRAHRNFILAPSAPRNIIPGDFVKVEADRGEDMGIVLSKCESSDFQEVIPTAGYRGRGFSCGQGERKYLYRLATTEERISLSTKVEDEERALMVIREKVEERCLPMVILDAEYQFDRHKLTYFFEAERRIDFRELVSELFSLYKTRIWMQQVDTSVLSMHDAGTELAKATGFLPPSSVRDLNENSYGSSPKRSHENKTNIFADSDNFRADAYKYEHSSPSSVSKGGIMSTMQSPAILTKSQSLLSSSNNDSNENFENKNNSGMNYGNGSFSEISGLNGVFTANSW
eukprot:gene7544-10279_t